MSQFLAFVATGHTVTISAACAAHLVRLGAKFVETPEGIALCFGAGTVTGESSESLAPPTSAHIATLLDWTSSDPVCAPSTTYWAYPVPEALLF